MKINKTKILLILVMLLISVTKINAQGCSDAGFCSAGNGFKNREANFNNNFEIGSVFGVGEEKIKNYTQYANYTRDFSKTFSVSAKITFATAIGDYGTSSNLGDFFITTNFRFQNDEIAKPSPFSIILGAKIPLSDGNNMANNNPLPMVYQSSLGTFDVIAGINFTKSKWEFNTAIQYPLTENKNAYLGGISNTRTFFNTNKFQRMPDVMFRTTFKLKSENQKFVFKPNLLAVYHLADDTFLNTFGQREKIIDSKGFTINLNLLASYKISKSSYLEFSAASPFVYRKAKPDGLSRYLTTGLSFKTYF
jgi:hypothetical protein